MNTRTTAAALVTAALTLGLAGCSTASKNMAAAPAPAPVAVAAPAPPPPAPPTPPPVYVVEDVSFDFDKSTLKPSATTALDQVATGLRQQADVKYEVAGYTDSVGSEAYNMSLSARRAESVRVYLVDRGVDVTQLSTRAYGESNPVASNKTKVGRASNRRVGVQPIK